MRIRSLIFILLLLAFAFKSIAQGGKPTHRKVVQTSKNDKDLPAKRTRSKIVNDSVKNVYGPKTTLSTTEKELFEGQKKYVPLDTSIYNLHRWDFVRKFENKYQDLGNVGSAMNSIFPVISPTIGATPGYKVYDIYWETAEPRYYNTKSPFSRVNVIWGGKGRAMTHIEFTRNVHSRWNFGFNYRPLLIVKQIQPQAKNDYQVRSQYYDFYTTYESKNSRYKLLMSYRRLNHVVRENGGVWLTAIDTTYKGYFDPNSKPYLTAATSTELRNQLHLFQQFKLAKPAQLYHILDVNKQTNSFTDSKSKEPAGYFTYSGVDTAIVKDVNTFQVVQNEFGLKGNAAFLFYDFYFKLRAYSNTMSNLVAQPAHAQGTESYVGSKISLRFDSLSYLSGQAEYLLDGHYKIEGALRTPWLDADLRSSLAKPGLVQQAYRGGYNSWSNNLTDVFSNQLSGRIKGKLGPVSATAGVSLTALHHLIYFCNYKTDFYSQVISKQSSGDQQIVSPEVNLEVRFLKRFHLRPKVIYTTIFNTDNNLSANGYASSIPAWFSNVQLSYENFVFNKALQLQMGIDAHWHSAYKALGYAPSIQQYFYQNDYVNRDFCTGDFFLNGRIKRGRFFVKYINLLQAFSGQGYLPTPGYPNVRNTIDFGFELILFD